MKYEFTGKTKVHLCITLKQIRATENFGVVVKGDIGGWIQSEANLDVYGNAWVYGDALVSGDARVQLQSDYFCAQGVGSEFGTLTAFRCEVGIKVSRGCFLGTLDEFRAAVREKHGEDSKVGRSYLGLSNWIEHWFSDAARGE